MAKQTKAQMSAEMEELRGKVETLEADLKRTRTTLAAANDQRRKLEILAATYMEQLNQLHVTVMQIISGKENDG